MKNTLKKYCEQRGENVFRIPVDSIDINHIYFTYYPHPGYITVSTSEVQLFDIADKGGLLWFIGVVKKGGGHGENK